MIKPIIFISAHAHYFVLQWLSAAVSINNDDMGTLTDVTSFAIYIQHLSRAPVPPLYGL